MRSSSLSARLVIALVISAMSSGLTNIAWFFAISGIEERFDVITGVPEAKASRMGNPKPS